MRSINLHKQENTLHFFVMWCHKLSSTVPTINSRCLTSQRLEKASVSWRRHWGKFTKLAQRKIQESILCDVETSEIILHIVERGPIARTNMGLHYSAGSCHPGQKGPRVINKKFLYGGGTCRDSLPWKSKGIKATRPGPLSPRAPQIILKMKVTMSMSNHHHSSSIMYNDQYIIMFSKNCIRQRQRDCIHFH